MNYKILLDKRHARQDNNKYPLKLRLYDGTKYKDRSLDIFLYENGWDASAQKVLEVCEGCRIFLSSETKYIYSILDKYFSCMMN